MTAANYEIKKCKPPCGQQVHNIFEWSIVKKKRKIVENNKVRTMSGARGKSNTGLYYSTLFNKHCVSRIIDPSPDSLECIILTLDQRIYTRASVQQIEENGK